MKKERLDKVLADLGYFETKSKASAAILAGQVKVNDELITKSGYQINLSEKYDFNVKKMKYVSRGGYKLQKAFEAFDIHPKGRICLDAGASTGGFTDCLLQYGAKFVYAADVGYGQIAWKLRTDKRVKTIEKINLKICKFEDIYSENEKMADLLVSDMSFISIEKVLPNLKTLLNPDFHEMICLIKPQFEAGKEFVEKGGIVRDKLVHKSVIQNVVNFVQKSDYGISGLTYSPVKGSKGNIEYLIWFKTNTACNVDFDIDEVVNSAHYTLNL